MSNFQMKRWIKWAVLLIILITLRTPLQNYFIGLFFVPDQDVRGNPSEQGILYEDVTFQAKNGQKRHGFFMKPAQKPLGTIVHCHGNAGNITCHYDLTAFLVQAGYNVFAFDYAGYGKSEGKPSPEMIVQDTLDAVSYVRTREDVNKTKIALFGQSLGGAAAAGAMAKDKDIKCLILEGTFTTYREMAYATITGKALFFITPYVIPDFGPETSLDEIAPRPLLILHGTEDNLIPVRFAHQLYKKAHHKKVLSVIDGLHHLHGDEVQQEYQASILNFFKEHL